MIKYQIKTTNNENKMNIVVLPVFFYSVLVLIMSGCSEESRLKNITDSYRSNLSRQQDFLPQGDGTVIDKRTKLQWMRCSLGQKWTEQTCEGDFALYDWVSASKQTMTFAGYSDWRLPKIEELETLIICKHGNDFGRGDDMLFRCEGNGYKKPSISHLFLPNAHPSKEDDLFVEGHRQAVTSMTNHAIMNGNPNSVLNAYAFGESLVNVHNDSYSYWSATSSKKIETKAWAVIFHDGYAETGNKKLTGYVRLVRKIQ